MARSARSHLRRAKPWWISVAERRSGRCCEAWAWLRRCLAARPAKRGRWSDCLRSSTWGTTAWRPGRTGKITAAEDLSSFRGVLRSFLDRLRNSLDLPEVLIEAKGLSASVHYRRASEPEETRRKVLDAIAAIQSDERFLITEGRMIVEIRPPVEVNKGTAVGDLVRRHGLEGAVYLGDDLTDLDAFGALSRLEQQGRLKAKASIAVRALESPREVLDAADATVDGVDGVAKLLEALSGELS